MVVQVVDLSTARSSGVPIHWLMTSAHSCNNGVRAHSSPCLETRRGWWLVVGGSSDGRARTSQRVRGPQ